MTQGSIAEYVTGGQTPFFRLPTVLPGAGSAAADVVMLGVPYDAGTTFRPGARFGPYAVRRASARLESWHPQHGVDVFGEQRVVDGGNAMVPPFSAGAMREIVEAFAAGIVSSGAAPFVVGGDHSISLPVLRALAREHGPLSLVHVDAHFDTSDGLQWGEAYHHGTPIRHALQEGLVRRGGLFQVGIRGPFKGPDEAEVVAEHDGRVWSADQVGELGPAEIASEIAEAIGDAPVYLSFDIDAIDPAFAPGTGTPVSGGLTAREALALVRGLAGVRLLGMDLVEVTPDLDHADATALLGAHLLWEGLALRAIAAHT